MAHKGPAPGSSGSSLPSPLPPARSFRGASEAGILRGSDIVDGRPFKGVFFEEARQRRHEGRSGGPAWAWT